MKRISVCMTTYNGELYVYDQIKSILPQLSDKDELLISDDGSSDKTLEIIREFKDSRITLYQNSFGNHILNFEFVLSKAQGDYLFLCDQDDVWMSNKVQIMLSSLSEHSLVCSNCYVVDENLNSKGRDFYNGKTKLSGFLKNFIKNNYLGCCIAFRRELLEKALPFPKKLITHDMWLGLIAEFYYNSAFIDNRLILFRRHNTNTSNTLKKSPYSFRKKVSYRLLILFNILRRLK